jgi:site-specific DNA recombinase
MRTKRDDVIRAGDERSDAVLFILPLLSVSRGATLGARIVRSVDHAESERGQSVRVAGTEPADLFRAHEPVRLANNVPSPRGGTWASSAIYGSPGKTTGILRNPLYIGRYVWNKSVWIKDPDTRKRVRSERGAGEWIEVDMPELRIVPQALWDCVQDRLTLQTARSLAVRQALHDRARRTGAPMRHLFSGLLKCAVCGSPFVTVGNNRYGCSGHKYRGSAVCGNGLSVKRSIVESRLLEGIKRDLYSPDAVDLFNRETRRLLQEAADFTAPNTDRLHRELAEVETKIENLAAAIAAGTFSPALQSALEAAEAKKCKL